MLDRLKSFFFPCEKTMKSLMSDHADSVARNQAAHDNLRRVCGEGYCLQGTFIPKINPSPKV